MACPQRENTQNTRVFDKRTKHDRITSEKKLTFSWKRLNWIEPHNLNHTRTYTTNTREQTERTHKKVYVVRRKRSRLNLCVCACVCWTNAKMNPTERQIFLLDFFLCKAFFIHTGGSIWHKIFDLMYATISWFVLMLGYTTGAIVSECLCAYMCVSDR